MARRRHRFWEDAEGQRLVRDSRGRFYYERDVPLGHHGGASPSASSGTSWTYIPTVSPSPPRLRRRHRHRSDRSSLTSDSSGSFYRRRPLPGGFGHFPGRFDAFPGGFDPFLGPGFPLAEPPSEAGSEVRPPLLGEIFHGGMGGEYTLP